jgi:hypothetical protein
MLEWVPAGLNIGALSGAKASSSRTRDNGIESWDLVNPPKTLVAMSLSSSGGVETSSEESEEV